MDTVAATNHNANQDEPDLWTPDSKSFGVGGKMQQAAITVSGSIDSPAIRRSESMRLICRQIGWMGTTAKDEISVSLRYRLVTLWRKRER